MNATTKKQENEGDETYNDEVKNKLKSKKVFIYFIT